MNRTSIIALVAAALMVSVAGLEAHAESVPTPLRQVQDDVPFDEIQCRDGKVLMQSPDNAPACVNESSSAKLAERGWNAVARSQTNQEASYDEYDCKGQQETVNTGKFDPGLFERIGKMLNANVTNSYSVLLTVSDGENQAVEQILVGCHGATDVVATGSPSFVTAGVPLVEIPTLSAYDEVRQIGAGEPFEIPVILDDWERTTWIQIDPVRCGGNPWGDARSSPDVIKEYYAELGVDVFDLKTKDTRQLVCQACSCPYGITLSLRVSYDDVRTMLSLGFMPPDKQPDTSRKPMVSSADAENTGDRPFVTTWRTISPNESITIPVGNATGTYTVDWGDGSTSANATGDQSHMYSDAGEYTVRISGDFARMLLGEDHDNAYKIISVEQWGDIQWESMASAFSGVVFASHAADTPDLSKVTDMSRMFQDSDFNGSFFGWDVSGITDMRGIFQNADFNGDISSWDVSSVTDMHRMFARSDFNGDISRWNVSSVKDMGYMFTGTPFNGDISDWDVSGVTNMRGMFLSSPFNGYISNWDVSGVKDMGYMFTGASFNGYISNWDVSGVKDMDVMFGYATFNGDLSNWDVSGVTDMSEMFYSADSFKGDISDWDVSGVTDMSEMFFGTDSFKGDISDWDVSSVEDMSKMFQSSVFNGDLSNWDVSSVKDMSSMFGNSLFLGGISGWDVSSVKDMSKMFSYTPFFHSNLSGWDVSNVENMYRMFRDSSFNGDISGWDVSSVTNMSGMFLISSFNGDISNWDVSGVTDMTDMFRSASDFNVDLSGWDVSNVTNMREMFYAASSFNGDLSGWDVSNVENMHRMFTGASSFNGDLSGWDVSNVENMNRMFARASAFHQNLGSWYIVLDRTVIDGSTGVVGRISAQNGYLDSRGPEYNIGSGGDYDYFEIVNGNVLRMKNTEDISEKSSYVLNITSTGEHGTGNFRVFEITVS